MWASLIVFAVSSAEASSRDCRSSHRHVLKTNRKRRHKVPLDIFCILITQRVSQSTNPPNSSHVFVQYPLNSSQISVNLCADAANTSPTFPSTRRSFTRRHSCYATDTPPFAQQTISSGGAGEKQTCCGIPNKRKEEKRFFQWKPVD